MSKGEKTIFFLSLALAAAPEYLFVDDVVHFLDPHLREVFLTSILQRIEEKRLTVIMASQSAFEIEGIPELDGNRLGEELFGRIQWGVETLAAAADTPGVAIDLNAGTVTYSERF